MNPCASSPSSSTCSDTETQARLCIPPSRAGAAASRNSAGESDRDGSVRVGCVDGVEDCRREPRLFRQAPNSARAMRANCRGSPCGPEHRAAAASRARAGLRFVSAPPLASVQPALCAGAAVSVSGARLALPPAGSTASARTRPRTAARGSCKRCAMKPIAVSASKWESDVEPSAPLEERGNRADRCEKAGRVAVRAVRGVAQAVALR